LFIRTPKKGKKEKAHTHTQTTFARVLFWCGCMFMLKALACLHSIHTNKQM
jgi:hypothetical protein